MSIEEMPSKNQVPSLKKHTSEEKLYSEENYKASCMLF